MFKKNFFQVVLVPSIFVSALTICHVQLHRKISPKKKILIFTSPGGGGHMSATKALQEYLGSEYEISTSFIFQEVLNSFDPISKITFGYSCGESTYNLLISKKFYGTLNAMAVFGTWTHSALHASITKRIIKFLEHKKPDLVISVVPFVNNALLEATESLDIPFVMIPTDLDIRTFIGSIKKPTHPKFHLILGIHDEEILERVEQAEIPEVQVTVGGFPLRPDFFTPKNTYRIKKEFHIPDNKQVLMIMMGAAGSNATYKYLKQLTSFAEPLHVIVILGRNEQLRHRVAQLKFHENVSITVLGFTQRVADIMAISDFCLTKSGTVSYCEAIYSGKAVILLDATSNTIRWERFNHRFNEKYFLGYLVKRYDALPQILSQLLHNPHVVTHIKGNLGSIEKKQLRDCLNPILTKLFKK